MGTVVREDDLLVVNVSVHYPSWLDDLSEDEFDNVMKSAEEKAAMALAREIHQAEQYWRARKMANMLGQMNIYDYV